MKNYVSYVIQGPDHHTHYNETINIDSPPYSYTNEPNISAVMKWIEGKHKELQPHEEIIVVNIFKL